MEKKDYRFEQYKILIESAEKNSDKRITQNNIYLTINLAFLSYILSKSEICFFNSYIHYWNSYMYNLVFNNQ